MAFWTPTQVEIICANQGWTENSSVSPTDCYDNFAASTFNHLPPRGAALPVGVDSYPAVYTYMSQQSS